MRENRFRMNGRVIRKKDLEEKLYDGSIKSPNGQKGTLNKLNGGPCFQNVDHAHALVYAPSPYTCAGKVSAVDKQLALSGQRASDPSAVRWCQTCHVVQVPILKAVLKRVKYLPHFDEVM